MINIAVVGCGNWASKIINEINIHNKFNLTSIVCRKKKENIPKTIIFDSIDNNVFRINYDIGNSAYEGFDFKEEINDYFNLIENVHVKDRTLKGPSVPLGEGEAKVVNVLKELKFRGYNKNLILQAARIPQIDDVELMKQYKKFVENAIF